MQKVEMTLFVLGVRRGEFKNDDGEQVKYCAVFASDDVHQSQFLKGDALGQVVQKIRAEPVVVDEIRHAIEKQGGTLPLFLKFEASLDFAIDGGSKVKALHCLGVAQSDNRAAQQPAKKAA